MKILSIITGLLFLSGCAGNSWTRFYYDEDGIMLNEKKVGGKLTGKLMVSPYESPIAVMESNTSDESSMTVNGATFTKNSKAEPLINKITETTVALTTAKMMED